MTKTIPLYADKTVVQPGTPNPFIRGTDGRVNVSKVMALVKANPQLARRLCRDAGEDWPSWTGEGRGAWARNL